MMAAPPSMAPNAIAPVWCGAAFTVTLVGVVVNPVPRFVDGEKPVPVPRNVEGVELGKNVPVVNRDVLPGKLVVDGNV